MAHIVISVQYYAFTTLSTVGLGDFHPTNNQERLFICAVFLTGITTSSLLIQNFDKATKELSKYIEKNNCLHEFGLFLSTLKKFNENEPLEPQTIQNLEQYFEYRWSNDLLIALQTEEDMALLSQLPGEVRL